MKRKRISEVISNIDESIIEESITHKRASRSNRTRAIKIVAACAACLVLITAGAVAFLRLQSEKINIVYIGGVKREYKKDDKTPFVEYVAYVWPWKYLNVANQYPNINYNGKEYRLNSSNIDSSHIGESLGFVEAFGYDATDNNKEYRRSFEIFKIKDINGDTHIAAYMDDQYALFADYDYTTPATLGEFINLFNLTKNLEFKCFYDYKSNERLDYYSTPDSDGIWEQLIKCADTPIYEDEIDLWLSAKRDFIAFDLKSDVFGIYIGLGGVDITTDGYLEFSMFGRDHIYYIGKDAANNIIAIAKKNATESQRESTESVTGYVTAIKKDCIFVDDSAFCKNSEDGMVFKIMVDERLLKGYVEVEGLEVGDLVSVDFFGKVDTDNDNLISKVYGINQARMISIDEDEYEIMY